MRLTLMPGARAKLPNQSVYLQQLPIQYLYMIIQGARPPRKALPLQQPRPRQLQQHPEHLFVMAVQPRLQLPRRVVLINGIRLLQAELY